MNQPTIILTGSRAGQWYKQELNRLFSCGNSAVADAMTYRIIQTDFKPINPDYSLE